MIAMNKATWSAALLLLPPFQEEGGFSIPWWVWFVLVVLALVLLMIILIRQQEPGETIPSAEEQIKSIQAEAAARNIAVTSEVNTDDSSIDESPIEETTPIKESDTPESSEETSDEPIGESVSDDLTRIEGIGPKTTELLQQAGIVTFSQLAETDIEHLDKILDEANLHFADESTWPEQAALAAAGNWDELAKLQDELKAGRRSS